MFNPFNWVAFQVSYDSRDPKNATLTTSNNNKQYELKRLAGDDAARFSDRTVEASFSGNEAKVEGVQLKLTGCKLKTTT